MGYHGWEVQEYHQKDYYREVLECLDCKKPIKEGDRILKHTESFPNWVHCKDCGQKVMAQAKKHLDSINEQLQGNEEIQYY